MTPRLSSSKKWTNFPFEYLKQIETVFLEAFADFLPEAELKVEGRIYPSEICLRVGVLPQGRLKQANFEASLNYDSSKNDITRQIHGAVDAIASMMDDYFEDEEDVDFPIVWTPYNFDGLEIFMQFSTVNSDLEAQADAILGLKNDSLVRGNEDLEDALEHAEVDPELGKEPEFH